LIPRQDESNRESIAYYVRLAINGLAVAAQITGFVLWPASYIEDHPRIWILPIALFLISCGWWENYLVAAKLPGKFDTITIKVYFSLPLASFPSSVSGTYQLA
jgi:hypothetical protein